MKRQSLELWLELPIHLVEFIENEMLKHNISQSQVIEIALGMYKNQGVLITKPESPQ